MRGVLDLRISNSLDIEKIIYIHEPCSIVVAKNAAKNFNVKNSIAFKNFDYP